MCIRDSYQRDTLLYVGKLDAFITSFGIFGGGLELSRGEIADARLYLRQTPGGEMNIKQIVDRISDPDKPKKGNFRLSLKKAVSYTHLPARRCRRSAPRQKTCPPRRRAWVFQKNSVKCSNQPNRPLRSAPPQRFS